MGCPRCCPWQEIGADTILEDFDFPERESFISLYPQGYCNVDKQVRRMCSTACYVAQFSYAWGHNAVSESILWA